MKPRKILFIGFALLLIPTTAVPTPIVRCFIAYPNGNLQERIVYELKSATAVFSGKVIAKDYRPVKNPAAHLAGSEELVIKISVDRWWKGDGKEEMQMYTGEINNPDGMIWSYAEDFHFEMGKAYLVYAFGEANWLHTNVCHLTQKIEQAEDQLRILGEGESPKKKSQ